VRPLWRIGRTPIQKARSRKNFNAAAGIKFDKIVRLDICTDNKKLSRQVLKLRQVILQTIELSL
jgi:hypothetical protein